MVPRTRLALPRTDLAVLLALGAVAGVVLGAVLDPVARWAVRQEWLPARDLLGAVNRFAAGAPLWAQLLVGAGVGVVVAALLATQVTVVEVADDELVVVTPRRRHRFARAQVGAVALEGRRLSVRDHEDVDLWSEKVDSDRHRLREVLDEHRWPVRT